MIDYAHGIGLIAILIGLFLLVVSFLPLMSRWYLDGGVRLISGILCLGGLRCIWNVYMEIAIARYTLVIVGMALILSSIVIVYDLRPQKAKRKAKPKRM